MSQSALALLRDPGHPVNLLDSHQEHMGRGGREVEGGRLEICCGGNLTGGSNPSLSARYESRVYRVNKNQQTVNDSFDSPDSMDSINGDSRRGGRAAEGARLESVFRET